MRRISSENRSSVSVNDDEEEMEIDEDYESTYAEVCEPQRERRQTSQNVLVPPGQRGANHIDMFNLIQQGVSYSGKIVNLLSKSKNTEQLKRMESLIGRLAKFDKDLDLDRRAIDETNRQHSKDNSDKKILHTQFNTIRESLQVEDPGRHQQEIGQISSRLAGYVKTIQQTSQQNIERNNSIVEEEDGEGDDDDMEMLNHYISDKDPFTKKRIQEPVKNPICGHVYERESVEEHIRFQKSRRQLYQCPVQRCTNKQLLSMEQLMPFPEFFKFVRRVRSRSRAKSRS